MNWLAIDEIIKNALLEDNPYGDITTNSIIDEHRNCTVELIVKEKGVLAGLPVFNRVFAILGDVEVKFSVEEGAEVEKGQLIGLIKGNTRKVLTGERIALNLLQRISGIATTTATLVKELQGTNAKLLDTRKTTPNLRILEKYAVKIGGGHNHRFNLSDGILIKDNHIDAAGGIKEAIQRARKEASFVRKIEVEVENLEQLKEALDARADIIMLDNMDTKTMKEAVKIINGRALTEASGNVDIKTIKAIGETGVDFISCGMLTHSFKSLDISMKNLKLL